MPSWLLSFLFFSTIDRPSRKEKKREINLYFSRHIRERFCLENNKIVSLDHWLGSCPVFTTVLGLVVLVLRKRGFLCRRVCRGNIDEKDSWVFSQMDVYLLWKNLVESNLYFHWCIKRKTISLHKYCRQKHNNLAEESNFAAAKGKQCRKNEVELSRHIDINSCHTFTRICAINLENFYRTLNVFFVQY